MDPHLKFIQALARRTGVDPHFGELSTVAAYKQFPFLVAEYFYEANFINPAALSGWRLVWGIQVPAGQLGILDGAANAVQDVQDYDAMTWQIRVGGTPILGLDSIQGPFGSLAQLEPVFWPLMSNQRVEWWVNNTSSDPITGVTGLLKGRFFPNQLPSTFEKQYHVTNVHE